jgi:SAM-dependent methyltransferase
MLAKVKSQCLKVLGLIHGGNSFDGAAYWERRAKKFGRRAVLNIAHSSIEYDHVTEVQKQILLPLFTANLRGFERTVLDFGCGPGRFTADLANAVQGSAVGVDISRRLIDMAPKASNVTYRVLPNGILPHDDFKFDVVWDCLVLGGIPEIAIGSTAEALEDALPPGGLLFLAECTSNRPNGSYWFFRGAKYYQSLFPRVDLRVISTYVDVDDEISILCGRKREC